jgi:hypothetical protein
MEFAIENLIKLLNMPYTLSLKHLGDGTKYSMSQARLLKYKELYASVGCFAYAIRCSVIHHSRERYIVLIFNGGAIPFPQNCITLQLPRLQRLSYWTWIIRQNARFCKLESTK